MRDLTELNKLEVYLKDRGIHYERIDTDKRTDDYGLTVELDRHQIIVPQDGPERKWDAICQYGSYGNEKGLLEIYGMIVRPCGDDVEGYLTADDVIERIEESEIMKTYNDTDILAPTADVVERKIGKWINTGSGEECSKCHEIQYGYDSFRRYCPNCGAEMESK